jgi:uncharacterized membrane protein YhhN
VGRLLAPAGYADRPWRAAVNATAVSWLAYAFGFAVVDWYAVARQRRRLEYVCKPAATLALLATAIALDPTHPTTRVWFCVAIVFCAAGDAFLMLPRDAFVPGLASFLVAQLCVTVGNALIVTSWVALIVAAIAVSIVAVPLSVRYLRALTRSDASSLALPVLAYIGAITAMVVTASASGVVLAAVGAALFFASDALIAETRFVGPRPGAPVVIMVTYHLALAALVLSLAL